MLANASIAHKFVSAESQTYDSRELNRGIDVRIKPFDRSEYHLQEERQRRSLHKARIDGVYDTASLCILNGYHK